MILFVNGIIDQKLGWVLAVLGKQVFSVIKHLNALWRPLILSSCYCHTECTVNAGYDRVWDKEFKG